MASPEPLTQGERIAQARRRRRLSQSELAAMVGRSESWVGQVERGVHTIDRVSILRALADALQVTPEDIEPPEPPPAEPTPRANDLEGLRLALTGHPALAAIFDGEASEPAPAVDELAERVDAAWALLHASRYAEVSTALGALIPALEAATLVGVDEAHPLLARTYQAAAAAFTRQDEPDAAWVAADRAVAAAQRAGDPLGVMAGHFRMAHTFSGLQRYDQADRVVESALSALGPMAAEREAAPEVLSLYGAITLADAANKAREGKRSAARAAIERAEKVADRLGADRNDFSTEFGPTNVRIHAITVAVDLGDAGEALDIAEDLDVGYMSPERQGRFHLDVARAHAQRGQIGDATAALLRAEAVAPEQTLSHPRARETIDQLLRLAGRRPSDELTELAARAAITG
jgi:transcriptional regulator with XRE-family HTH domain